MYITRFHRVFNMVMYLMVLPVQFFFIIGKLPAEQRAILALCLGAIYSGKAIRRPCPPDVKGRQ